eukprot:gene10935-biopygen22849
MRPPGWREPGRLLRFLVGSELKNVNAIGTENAIGVAALAARGARVPVGPSVRCEIEPCPSGSSSSTPSSRPRKARKKKHPRQQRRGRPHRRRLRQCRRPRRHPSVAASPGTAPRHSLRTQKQRQDTQTLRLAMNPQAPNTIPGVTVQA